jgi:valyl-tRNA synthetase
MEKAYNHKELEGEIYQKWEGAGVFAAASKGEPYTILMPPPNANASLHAGHAMYTVDDILVRWKRMQGYSAVWIPGMDHAGFETQFVYEKHLAKQGKSRFDYDRQTLYQNIYQFVRDNSGLIYEQFKRLGFSADWKKSVFTLDKSVLERVFETFSNLEKEGLVYRAWHIVNYCTACGTSLAELEVDHQEREDKLYYIRYPLLESQNCVVVATTRPEPIWVDTHLAVHPDDKKNNWLIGSKVKNPLTDEPMEIIGDTFVDQGFGTGIVKLTPAHDQADFECAQRHGLPIRLALDTSGRMVAGAGKYQGLKVREAREAVVADLDNKGLVEKIDDKYEHAVKVCYRCKRDLEPMTILNWFIKVDELKKPAIEAVKKDKVRFYPRKYKRQMLDWLAIMHDWPISRQIVWGIRIPVWYDTRANQDLEVTTLVGDKKISGNYQQLIQSGITPEEIQLGLQQVRAGLRAKYVVSSESPGDDFVQETDTFDTWFSSGQWPLVTLGKEIDKRLPTNVMGTLSDILKFWVSRMVMFSLYREKKVPFKDVYLWSMVADAKGQKMSKSKGNVINPIDLIDKYGADALRMTMVFGVAPGGKVPLAEEKVKGMRNFANKIWNVGRYVINCRGLEPGDGVVNADDVWILEELEKTSKMVTEGLEKFRFGDAAESVYEFMWHKFADVYIEKTKDRKGQAYPTLMTTLITALKLLHPFMPFVTEAVYQQLVAADEKLNLENKLLISSSWPI